MKRKIEKPKLKYLQIYKIKVMSKHLGTVMGMKEIPDASTRTSVYNRCEMDIVSFYGGINRGRCIQLTIPADSDGLYAHIQLTAEGVDLLRNILNDWGK